MSKAHLLDRIKAVHAAGGGTFTSEKHTDATVRRALIYAKNRGVAVSPRSGWYRAAGRPPAPAAWARTHTTAAAARFTFGVALTYPLDAPADFVAHIEERARTWARTVAESERIAPVDITLSHVPVVWAEHPDPVNREWTRAARTGEDPISMECRAHVDGLYLRPLHGITAAVAEAQR